MEISAKVVIAIEIGTEIEIAIGIEIAIEMTNGAWTVGLLLFSHQ